MLTRPWMNHPLLATLSLIFSLFWTAAGYATSPAQQMSECIAQGSKQQQQATHAASQPNQDPSAASGEQAAEQRAQAQRQQRLLRNQCSAKLHQQDRQRANEERYASEQRSRKTTDAPPPLSSTTIAPLVAGGSISGTVTDSSGNPAPSTWVYAHKWNGSYSESRHDVLTDASGNYSHDNLPPGTYRLEFDDTSGNLVNEYYDDATSLETATDIEVTDLGSVTNINAQLSTAGHITGNVTDHNGNPIDGMWVPAYRWNGNFWSYQGNGDYTDAAGNYDIGSLPAGNHRVEFSGNADSAAEYYDNAADVNSATDIPVTAGNTTSGIDAQLAQAGSISGTVTDAGGSPLAGIQVYSYRFDSANRYWAWAGKTAITDASGNYTIVGMTADTYRIEFNASGSLHVSEYFNDAPAVDTADDVVVIPGATTTSINGVLAEAGQISGTVTDNSATPIANVNVNGRQWDGNSWQYVGNAQTDASGNYTIGSLAAGTYRVEFNDYNGGHLKEFFANAQDVDNATDVTVNAGATTNNINVVLAAGGHITGTITDSRGNPLQGIQVSAGIAPLCDYGFSFPSDGFAETDATGFYDIGSLRTGDYDVFFRDPQQRYLNEYFDDAPDSNSATPVAVTEGTNADNIDAQLTTAAHITGHVADDTGAPLEGVDVRAWQWTGSYWEIRSSNSTDGFGDYDLGGLAAGNYRIEFNTFFAWDHAGEFYSDAADQDSAADVNVTTGGTTSGIDAELAEAGFLSGTATDINGAPLEGISVDVARWNGNDWETVDFVHTDASGFYRVGGLHTNLYRVDFNDDFIGNPDYLITEINNISVTLGASTTGIDSTLPPAGKIAGILTDPAGNPHSNSLVTAFAWNGSEWDDESRGFTNTQGEYIIGRLETSIYRVGADDGQDIFARTYYPNSSSAGNGSDVAVTTGATTPNIDIQLGLGGNIAGAVTDPAGNPLPCIEVNSYIWNGSQWVWDGGTQTGAGGLFDISGANDDDHRVEFQDFFYDLFQSEVYDNASSLDNGTNVPVSAGNTTPNINAQLALAGTLPPVAPTLIAPNSASTETQPTYSWNPVAGADDYLLFVTDSSGNVINTWYTASAVGCSGNSGTCSITPGTTLATGDVDWWVRARNSAGQSPWSALMEFTVQAPPPPPVPVAATLISPAGAVVGDTPTYTWEAVADSSDYYLQVNDATGNRILQWYTAAEAGCDSGTGNCSVTPATTVQGASQWWIRTWNSSGNGPWSNAMDFTAPTPVTPTVPAAAVLTSPQGGINTITPTYTWQAVADASDYYLQVNDSSGNRILKWYTAAEAGCASGTGSCSVTPATSVLGSSQWWIRTWNSVGNGPWSSAMEFTATNPNALPAATLVSPTGSGSNTMPTYKWNAVAASTFYLLYVDDATGNRINTWYSAAEAGCDSGTGICSVTPTIEVQGASQWWVQTWNSSESGPWSSAENFTVTGGIPAAATLVSPLSPGGDSDYTLPTYVWNAVDGASWYQLQVNDASGNRIKTWYTAAEAGCAMAAVESPAVLPATVPTCSVTPSTEVKGTNQWWVRTNNIFGNGPWSSAGDFTINGAIPAAATPTSPNGNIGDSTPTYSWDAVAGATWYYLYVDDATGNRIAEWIAASELGCAGGTGTCSTTPTTELSAGSGEWWLQTWNSYGTGPWSTSTAFELGFPAP